MLFGEDVTSLMGNVLGVSPNLCGKDWRHWEIPRAIIRNIIFFQFNFLRARGLGLGAGVCVVVVV